MDFLFQIQTPREMLVLVILLATPFVVNYSIAWILFFTAVRSTAAGKKPPSLPYMVPLLGSVVSYVLDPLRFVTTAGYVSLAALTYGESADDKQG